MIVWVLLVVFAGFAVVTLVQMDPSLLAFSTYPSWSKVVASVALTFFAYLGFSVVTFTAGDLDDPARTLPRAMYLALGITALVYVAVSLGVFGTLTVDEVIENGDTALAEAARPVLGDAGFTIMAITALLATSSSVNSNIFAAGNLTFALSDSRSSPGLRPARLFRGRRGVTITVVLVLDSRQCVRPERDRLARERGVSGRLPRGWRGRAATPLGVGLKGLADRGHDARDVDRAPFFAIDTARNAPETFAACWSWSSSRSSLMRSGNVPGRGIRPDGTDPTRLSRATSEVGARL